MGAEQWGLGRGREGDPSGVAWRLTRRALWNFGTAGSGQDRTATGLDKTTRVHSTDAIAAA